VFRNLLGEVFNRDNPDMVLESRILAFA